jgi:ribosomal-protein-alanine N-acetyltransferase
MILAIDTSGDALLVAIADRERVYAEHNGSADRRHSESIVTAIDTVLRASDITADRLESLAVMTGPGSFTGLRVGIATALGLAEAWGKPILSVGNFELARRFWAERQPTPVIAIHCRGDEFFVAEGTSPVEVLPGSEIVRRFEGRVFAGAGAARLLQAVGPESGITTAIPIEWSAGDLAKTIAVIAPTIGRLDPINLDVNYMTKSQPELRREQTQVEVGELTLPDLADVLAIEQEAFSDPWESSSFESDIANQHVIALAARLGGRCVGYLSCIAIEDYGYIANIAVHREQRSHGIGRRLLDELRRRLELRQVFDLVLDVRASNLSAIRFYERYGFQVLTRRKGFYSKPPEDSLTMLRTGKK